MLRRHDLVRLTPDGWEQVLAGLADQAQALAQGWRARDLPAVARRTEPGTAPGHLCLGIPAPPDPHSGQKLRIGFAVAREHACAIRPALTLDEAEVPAVWHAGWSSLRIALRAAGVDCRVFGSVAMQTLTGAPYLGPASDIDLLLRPASRAQLDAGLALLAAHAQGLPLDGEVEFPSGHAVSWKEWLGPSGQGREDGAGRVLAKHLDAVALLRRDALLGQFGAEGGWHG